MRYYVKIWMPSFRAWKLSTRVDQNGYANINTAHDMKEFAAKAEASAGYPNAAYIVTDDRDAQPPAPI